MSKVKLEETKDRRRLHICSYFVDLNESDYQELRNIFGEKSNNISSQPTLVVNCRFCDAKFEDEYALEAHIYFNHKSFHL